MHAEIEDTSDVKYHNLYLDEAPFMRTANGFHFMKKMEWLQPAEWYLLAIVRHEGVLQVAGTTYPFPEGSAIVVPPGSRCRIEGTHPETRGRHWWFNFKPSEEGLHKVALPTVTPLGDAMGHWVSLLVKAMDNTPYTRAATSSLMWTLLWAVSENAAEVRSHPALTTAEEYVKKNLSTSLSVAELAEAAHLSHNHLIRLFREEHGMTPSEFIRAQRMNKACHLLLSTEIAIKEIGQQVGYSNVQHFHNLVKQVFGCSPQDIRTNRAVPDIHRARA